MPFPSEEPVVTRVAPREVPIITRGRPPIFIGPVVPKPPAITAKPRPPPPTFSMVYGNLLAHRLANRVLGNLHPNYHPVRLLPVDTITDSMRAAPFRSRTGMIHPLFLFSNDRNRVRRRILRPPRCVLLRKEFDWKSHLPQ